MTKTTGRRARVLGLACALGAAAVGLGCQTQATRHVPRPALEEIGLDAGHQGDASDVVFSSPRIHQYYIAISPETLEELRRRDRELSIVDRAPVSALTTQWPDEPRPDLAFERTGRTRPYTDRGFIYYDVGTRD